MPRFYFNIFDGKAEWSDDEGTLHDDLPAAREEAIETLTNMSREVFPPAISKLVWADILDEDRATLERVEIELSVRKP